MILESTSSASDFETLETFKQSIVQDFSGRVVVWRNNNSTLETREAVIVDLNDLDWMPHEIIRRAYEFNRDHTEEKVFVASVAGFESPLRKQSWFTHILKLIFGSGVKDRLTEEYAQSFSLSPWSTVGNRGAVTVVMRVSKAAQKMKIIKSGREVLFDVTPGVRITDAESYLFKKGYALFPNSMTLHTASIVGGAANGGYAPGRDEGPMSVNIKQLVIVGPDGEEKTLSKTQNRSLFYALRDAHLGAGFFVKKMRLGNIEKKFRMRRVNVLYADSAAFAAGMRIQRWLNKQYFMAMYIPVDILETDQNHFNRIRVTTFERTDEKGSRKDRCRNCDDTMDYLNLQLTEAGEPLIDCVTRSKRLRPFIPFLLKFAAVKTYGLTPHTHEIDWSHKITHIFRTYTDLPIRDVNWLIEVESVKEAAELNIQLIKLTERKLKRMAANEHYPLFNAFSRYLKGVHFPKENGGIACTVTSSKSQSILSFEYVTYEPLARTPQFRQLVDSVVTFLNKKSFFYNYHTGKNWPAGVTLPDVIVPQRLRNFQNALIKLHGGEDGLRFSPFLTPQKREFIGFDTPAEDSCEEELPQPSAQEEKEALDIIASIAGQLDSSFDDVVEEAEWVKGDLKQEIEF